MFIIYLFTINILKGALEISDLEDNQMLRLTDDEPETWNAAADKKVCINRIFLCLKFIALFYEHKVNFFFNVLQVIKKLKEREIKRQEAIYGTSFFPFILFRVYR